VDKANDSQETPALKATLPENSEKSRVISSQQGGEEMSEMRTRDFGIMPIPLNLRYDPAKPFHFGIALNVAFGFFSTFSRSICECSMQYAR
jgi:hypothetical protein